MNFNQNEIMVYKTKKYKFAVIVDEYGRKKRSLNNLLSTLSEDYPFLKQAGRLATTKRVAAAKVDDVIIFGFSKKYDFKVVTPDEWEEYSIHRRTPELDLSESWYDIKEALADYAEANYPDEFEDDTPRDCYCRTSDVLYVDNDRDWEDLYVVLPSSKKRKQQQRKTTSSKKLSLDNVQVKHNHVKVGWDVFDIWLNENDDEYVNVDGNVYWIDRDSYGRGKLSVQ